MFSPPPLICFLSLNQLTKTIIKDRANCPLKPLVIYTPTLYFWIRKPILLIFLGQKILPIRLRLVYRELSIVA